MTEGIGRGGEVDYAGSRVKGGLEEHKSVRLRATEKNVTVVQVGDNEGMH